MSDECLRAALDECVKTLKYIRPFDGHHQGYCSYRTDRETNCDCERGVRRDIIDVALKKVEEVLSHEKEGE